jgi:hypothetical protein
MPISPDIRAPGAVDEYDAVFDLAVYLRPGSRRDDGPSVENEDLAYW